MDSGILPSVMFHRVLWNLMYDQEISITATVALAGHYAQGSAP